MTEEVHSVRETAVRDRKPSWNNLFY